MTRDEAIKHLKLIKSTVYLGNRKFFDALDFAISYLRQPEPHWIPCSERLPKEDTDVLVTYVNGEEIRIAPVNYGRGAWYDCIFETTLDPLKVTAWMPLPEPYREDGESE